MCEYYPELVIRLEIRGINISPNTLPRKGDTIKVFSKLYGDPNRYDAVVLEEPTLHDSPMYGSIKKHWRAEVEYKWGTGSAFLCDN